MLSERHLRIAHEMRSRRPATFAYSVAEYTEELKPYTAEAYAYCDEHRGDPEFDRSEFLDACAIAGD